MYSILQLTFLAVQFIVLTNSTPIHQRSPIDHSLTTSPGYGTLTLTRNGSIIRAQINNPPINLWDYKLASDISTFVDTLAENNTLGTRVVIFSSSNPDFFIAHYDLHVLSAASPPLPPGNSTIIGEQLVRTERNLATLPIIFIAEINGRISGAGDEFAVQCDIRYAGPNAKLSQLEVAFGFEPGSGGVQFLVKLIGRARALEYILTGRSVDAATAAAIGWVNTAFESAEKLHEGVDALAARIASLPKQGLQAVKASINLQKPSDADLDADLALFTELVPTVVSQKATDRYLKLSKNQTASAFELNEPINLPEIVPDGA
ncbi:hypothetical protein MMC21_006817 [Puttea exsequens]|nr:hypothetical protein [Puttea exsequens]